MIAAAVAVFMSVVVPCVWSLGYSNPRKVAAIERVWNYQSPTSFLHRFVLPADEVEFNGEFLRTTPGRIEPLASLPLPITKHFPDLEMDFPQILGTRIRAFGFPFRSMWYNTQSIAHGIDKTKRTITLERGIEFTKNEEATWYDDRCVLPLGVRWPQMLGNLAVWGGLVMVVWMGFGAKRWSRLRRGLCGFCGYPVGSERCPECGGETGK